MNLLLFLAFLCIHKSLASKESIQQKILNIKDTLKKMAENPYFGLSQRTSSSTYMIQLYIPPGPGASRYYGTQHGIETARKAVSMIANEYLKSLELVQNDQAKFPATFHQLKVKYDEIFPKLAISPIDSEISRVRNILKKIEKKPSMYLNSHELASHECAYVVRPNIPLGVTQAYGTVYDQTAAQGAVLMLVKEYLKSLELVREKKAESPATVEDLQLKYDKMFANNILSKFENTLKKIETHPDFGIQLCGNRYYVHLYIPPERLHWYGSHHEHETAQKAVLMIAQEYKKSLEAKSPATAHDLQLKYDAMFPETKHQIMISKFDDTLKKIEENPNFGLHTQFNKNRYFINVWIPIGESHSYGSHHDHVTARKAVLMIANEYKRSLEFGCPATFHQLKLKYEAMFGKIQNKVCLPSKCDHEENKLDIENRKTNLLMNFQITPQKPNQMHKENGTTQDDSELNEMLSRNHRERSSKKQSKTNQETLQKAECEQTFRKSTDEQNNANSSQETDEKNFHKVYKIRRIWNIPEHEPEHDFILGGYFKVVGPPDVFWVNKVKKIDGRLSGYYKEYGGCRGWVNLEYFDSTNFEGRKEVNETLKRKRKENESSIKSESEESTRESSNN